MRTAIVTGGASGIGLATTRLLLEEGWRVVAADRNPTALGDARGKLSAAADQLRLVELDVTSEEAVDTLVSDTASLFGPIGGVVNSAGFGRDVPFFDTTPDLFRQIHEVNVIGAFLVSRAAALAMRETGGGAIVNIASVSGMVGNIGRTAYGASKGAVIAMTQVMAVELAPHAIRVNTVAPGPIETPLVAAVHTPEIREGWHRTVPMRRYGMPEEIASTISFLLDDRRASYVTGQTLAVDGGFVASGLLAPEE
jgi:NAD(P)-dependent dehydrogenase (short-subunit alcohol dehydrogenase family)